MTPAALVGTSTVTGRSGCPRLAASTASPSAACAVPAVTGVTTRPTWPTVVEGCGGRCRTTTRLAARRRSIVGLRRCPVEASRIERGLVRISTLTRSEVGYAARTAADHRMLLAEPPLSSMPVEHLTPRIEDRAVEVQSTLAERGRHRAPSIPDLLIAATAELADLTVVHLDKDHELVAALAGQHVERLEHS